MHRHSFEMAHNNCYYYIRFDARFFRPQQKHVYRPFFLGLYIIYNIYIPTGKKTDINVDPL